MTADDGLSTSAPLEIVTAATGTDIVQLEVGNRELNLSLGDVRLVDATGLGDNGTEIELLPNEATYRSSNASVAFVTDRGLISAVGEGTSVITITVGGISAAIAVEVGDRAERLVEVFPLSYTMPTSETRQVVVRERLPESIINISDATDGAFYVAENPSIVAVDADGRMTAVASGTTRVTVISGGRARLIDVA